MPIEPIQPANILFSNRFVRYFLQSLEVVMGKKGSAGALQSANLAYLIENYPPENDEYCFDYATFSMLNAGLEAFIGRRLGRGFARRAGRHMLQHHLTDFDALANIDDTVIQALPVLSRIKITLPAMTTHIIQGRPADSTSSIYETETEFVVTLEKCPVCWGRIADNSPGTGANEPLCDALVGMYEGALWRISNGQKYHVKQTGCLAQGDAACVFQIAKEPFAH